jgi:hypothetical protein
MWNSNPPTRCANEYQMLIQENTKAFTMERTGRIRVVRADGVIISGVNNDGNPIPTVAAALEDLPDSAWSYGSVVAIQDYRIGLRTRTLPDCGQSNLA